MKEQENPSQTLEVPSGFSLLIVDDDPLVRSSLKAYLKALGPYKIHEATNAMDAITRLQEVGGVDAVLSDINMPGMDGIEFVRRVKEMDYTIATMIITGYPSSEKIVETMRAGASDFLAKPFSMDQLKVAMARLVKERKILLENRSLSDEIRAKKALEEINRKLERKVKEQAILFAISDTLGRTLNSRELYEQIVFLTKKLTGMKYAYFWVVNHQEGVLYLVAAEGEFPEAWERISLGDLRSPFVRAVHEEIPLLLPPGHLKDAPLQDRGAIVVPFMIRKETFGLLAAMPGGREKVSQEEALFLMHLLAERSSLTVENLLLYESVSMNLLATLKALVQSLEAKDPYTRQHSQRVTEVAIQLAQIMGCTPEEIDAIRFAGHLHDIGKIGIRDQVLLKPGKLTEEEYEIIKQHPVIGEEIISHIGLLPLERAIIRHHHERWDGRGYPDGLAREEIPKLSRILSVADTFDAMTSCRPYRGALCRGDAHEEISRNAGTQFDPEVVEAFSEWISTQQSSPTSPEVPGSKERGKPLEKKDG